jgi:hypothetical protein
VGGDDQYTNFDSFITNRLSKMDRISGIANPFASNMAQTYITPITGSTQSQHIYFAVDSTLVGSNTISSSVTAANGFDCTSLGRTSLASFDKKTATSGTVLASWPSASGSLTYNGKNWTVYRINGSTAVTSGTNYNYRLCP